MKPARERIVGRAARAMAKLNCIIFGDMPNPANAECVEVLSDIMYRAYEAGVKDGKSSASLPSGLKPRRK